MDNHKRAFVTGYPIGHSRSPLIHNYWLKKLGIDGEYLKHQQERTEQIEDFITGLNQSDFVGGNVTLPHKEVVFELVEKLHPTAKRLGAVNTVWLEDDILNGDNTDCYGFLANLDQQSPVWDSVQNKKAGALVLGAGGAARAIIDGLKERGFSPVIIANRTVERAEVLAEKFGSPCIAADINKLSETAYQCALVVNTTSIGMGDNLSPIDLSNFPMTTTVTDIVYSPLITPMLKQAEQRGMKTVDGLGMLLHQAVPGFEKWFGVRPEVTEELRNLIIEDLEKQA